MNITFFIGNGFDLNLDLNTRYSDFYPYFLEHAKKENMISSWLQKTQNDSDWSDLELKLGEELENIKTEDKKLKFYDDKAELAELLVEYLEIEQKRFSIKNNQDVILKKFSKDLQNFYSDLPEMQKQSILSTLKDYRNEPYRYCFINFNYTKTLDQIVNAFKNKKIVLGTHMSNRGNIQDSLGELVHIHGTITEEMVLAVNDETQIHNDFLKKDPTFLDIMIKSRINDRIGQGKIGHVKEIIKDSHIICIFGMSLGETDKIWRQEIVNWLESYKNNKLIIYYKGYEKELERKIPDITIRLDNTLKEKFLKKAGIERQNYFDQLTDRIYVLYNSDLFDFKQFTCVSNIK